MRQLRSCGLPKWDVIASSIIPYTNTILHPTAVLAEHPTANSKSRIIPRSQLQAVWVLRAIMKSFLIRLKSIATPSDASMQREKLKCLLVNNHAASPRSRRTKVWSFANDCMICLLGFDTGLVPRVRAKMLCREYGSGSVSENCLAKASQ